MNQDNNTKLDFNRQSELAVQADEIPWEEFEVNFKDYIKNIEALNTSTRLMISLVLLERIYELSDDEVLDAWVSTSEWQYFSGIKEIKQNKRPVSLENLVRFRLSLDFEERQILDELEISIREKLTDVDNRSSLWVGPEDLQSISDKPTTSILKSPMVIGFIPDFTTEEVAELKKLDEQKTHSE